MGDKQGYRGVNMSTLYVYTKISQWNLLFVQLIYVNEKRKPKHALWRINFIKETEFSTCVVW
jgi:hypothetical protein